MLPCAKLLSKMSEDQAWKLRELEREYEEVLDENCRVVAVYFKEVLVNKNGDALVSPSLLVPTSTAAVEGAGGGGGRMKNREETEMPMLENGRYNVIIFLFMNLLPFFPINLISVCGCYLNIFTYL